MYRRNGLTLTIKINFYNKEIKNINPDNYEKIIDCSYKKKSNILNDKTRLYIFL
jgi:hypothetical protein